MIRARLCRLLAGMVNQHCRGARQVCDAAQLFHDSGKACGFVLVVPRHGAGVRVDDNEYYRTTCFRLEVFCCVDNVFHASFVSRASAKNYWCFQLHKKPAWIAVLAACGNNEGAEGSSTFQRDVKDGALARLAAEEWFAESNAKSDVNREKRLPCARWSVKDGNRLGRDYTFDNVVIRRWELGLIGELMEIVRRNSAD